LQTRRQQSIHDQMNELEQNRQRIEMLAHELQHRAQEQPRQAAQHPQADMAEHGDA
jgi:hypothetical protein